jgi:2-dehydro-3-deoxyphosphogluconate aldolase/(4S)-4-hydroxy-2-oxoglutarate aldolase
LRSVRFERELLDTRFMAILRDLGDDALLAISSVLVRAGARVVEVPLSSPKSIAQVASLRRALPSEVMVGAGTVLSERQATVAHDSGADFLVTPHVAPDVTSYAAEHGLGTVCGAMTATEVRRAQELGATFVKVFPASIVGPDYISALLGPFPSLRAVAVGGVGPGNARAFLDAGAVAVGIGGAINRLASASAMSTKLDQDLEALVSSMRPDRA